MIPAISFTTSRIAWSTDLPQLTSFLRDSDNHSSAILNPEEKVLEIKRHSIRTTGPWSVADSPRSIHELLSPPDSAAQTFQVFDRENQIVFILSRLPAQDFWWAYF